MTPVYLQNYVETKASYYYNLAAPTSYQVRAVLTPAFLFNISTGIQLDISNLLLNLCAIHDRQQQQKSSIGSKNLRESKTAFPDIAVLTGYHHN